MSRITSAIRKLTGFIMNPRLLVCLGIAWMITNGWSYAAVTAGALLDVPWLTGIGAAYLSMLWFPFTPEKIITVIIALWLLKTFFPDDRRTLAVLTSLRDRLRGRMILSRRRKRYMKENRQYDEMLSAARRRMEGTDWERTAALSGAVFDPEKGEIRFESLGKAVTLKTGDLTVDPPLHIWHHLSVLQYLEAADGVKPSGRWTGLSSHPDGGGVRGASFDREIAALSSEIGRHPEDVILRAAEALGGEVSEDDRADICLVFRFMPYYPYRFNLWLADEDLPASGKMLADPSVMAVLGTEAAGTVASLITEMLSAEADRIAQEV